MTRTPAVPLRSRPVLPAAKEGGGYRRPRRHCSRPVGSGCRFDAVGDGAHPAFGRPAARWASEGPDRGEAGRTSMATFQPTRSRPRVPITGRSSARRAPGGLVGKCGSIAAYGRSPAPNSFARTLPQHVALTRHDAMRPVGTGGGRSLALKRLRDHSRAQERLPLERPAGGPGPAHDGQQPSAPLVATPVLAGPLQGAARGRSRRRALHRSHQREGAPFVRRQESGAHGQDVARSRGGRCTRSTYRRTNAAINRSSPSRTTTLRLSSGPPTPT